MRPLLALLLLAAPLLPQAPELETGALPDSWRASGPNCLEVPDWQINEYNPTFYIIRESGCTNYEKPFLYLIFGRDRALLVDTGAGRADTAGMIRDLMAKWSARNKRPAPPLLAVHSHGHGDHISGDKGLAELPNTTVVPATVDAEKTAFAIQDWPTQLGSIGLGERILDIIPIPGHHAAHVAYYDRKTGILLTGDHLYPGRLYVADFAAYKLSTKRLVDFTATRPIAHILGCHVEQSTTPFVDYPVGTVNQPAEHPLALARAHLLELMAGLDAMPVPARTRFRDFTIWPQPPRGN